MRALFCHDHFYKRTSAGDIVSEGQFRHTLWRRYLAHFDALTVIGRDGGFAAKNDDINVASTDNVDFTLFPNMNNLTGLLSGRRGIKHQIRDLVRDHDCVILRGISELGSMACREAKRQGKIVVLEMVACPWDSLWYYGGVKAKLYAPWRYLAGRKTAQNADAVIYVTNTFLQKRYPANTKIQAVASNVDIAPVRASILEQRDYKIRAYTTETQYRIGLIGALSNALKGIDIAITACHRLKAKGIDNFTLHILGPGDAEPYCRLVQYHNLENHVFFDGIRQSGAPVMEWLSAMDIYIQPSLQEGLPRAVIEAMSLGLPVIGSDAGGMSELLQNDAVIRKKDPVALANKIAALMQDKDKVQAQSRRNAACAAAYTANILDPKRDAFWREVSYLVAQNQPE